MIEYRLYIMQDVTDPVSHTDLYVELQISDLRPLPDRLISLLNLTAKNGFKGLMLNWGSSFPWTIGPFLDNRSSYSEEVVHGMTEHADRLNLEFIHKLPLIGDGNLFSAFPAFHDLSSCLETGEDFSKHSKRYRSLILDHLEDFFSLLPHAKFICLDAKLSPKESISPLEIREGLIMPITRFLSEQGCRMIAHGDFFLEARADTLSSLRSSLMLYVPLTGDVLFKLSSLKKAGLPLILQLTDPEEKFSFEESEMTELLGRAMEERMDLCILNPQRRLCEKRLADYTLEKQLETGIHLKDTFLSSRYGRGEPSSRHTFAQSAGKSSECVANNTSGESTRMGHTERLGWMERPDYTEDLSVLDDALEAAWTEIRILRETLTMQALSKYEHASSIKPASIICEELGEMICSIRKSIERLEEKLQPYYEEKESRTLLRSRLLPIEEEYGMLAPRARTIFHEL